MSIKSIVSIITLAVLLQGCVAAAVVGVVGEALSDNTNLQVISVNGSVLVIGQAPNSYLRDQAIKAINEVNGVKQLHNQIRISNTTSFTTKTNDVWLTSKVKTSLFGTEKLDATNIKVVTARNVSGVNRVFKIFEYVTENQAE